MTTAFRSYAKTLIGMVAGLTCGLSLFAQDRGNDPTGPSEPTFPGAVPGALYLNWVWKEYWEHTDYLHGSYSGGEEWSYSYGNMLKSGMTINGTFSGSSEYREDKAFSDFATAAGILNGIPFPPFEPIDLSRLDPGQPLAASGAVWGAVTEFQDETGTTSSGNDYRQQSIKASKSKVRLERANEEDYPQSFTYLKVTRNQFNGIVSAESLTLTIPAKRKRSPEALLELTEPNQSLSLLPVEVAPEVLAVNSDFDEGRIDPATGYAIPDCDDIPGVDQKTGSGNTQIALNASRAHLDGLFANDEKVTDDMHKGWFGVNPNQLGDDFWNGAYVTIRKIDKDDPDTGFKESGQVRFYAKWSGGYYGISPYDFQTLQAVNLVSAGVNGNNSSVYGASSTIPDGAEFYMEGVRPGKITLEWRLQKGTIDVKHEQTFKVETRKTVAEWQEEVRYQIRLQTKVKTGTEVDVAQYDTGNGFRNANAAQDNVLRVVAIYDYYQQLFKQMPEKFMWAGMAKVAAAPIYAGMSDLHTWWVNSGWFPRPEPRGFLDPGIQIFIKGLLLGGQKNIFTDKAWAHRAYKASGIGALNNLSQDFPDATNFEAWKLMDEGIFANDQNKIFEANGRLLRREQQEVVQQNYDIIQNLWIYQPPAHPNINGGVWVAVNSEGLSNAGEWLSANLNNNPLPGGPGFRATFPGGRLDFFNDRWAWTSNSASGMLEIWTGASTSAPGYNAGRRASENDKTIKAAATNYSYDPAGIP